MTIIGIDAGTNGGISWTRSNGKTCAEKMPDTIKDLWEVLQSIEMDYNEGCTAYLEQVHSSPQMGVKSAFTFGNGFGHLEMALTALEIPFHRVRPQEWQKAMGCLTKGDKNVSKSKAQELFPSIKVTHAIADSLLIMQYGINKLKL
jgi:hypothetical protein